MGDSCVSKSEAEYQKYYAKCEIGKKHKKHRNDQVDDDAEESGYFAEVVGDTASVAVSVTVEGDASSDNSYGPGGGSYGPGGGGAPGGGDYPGGQDGCMDLKSKKKCLRGSKGEVCAWCEGSYMGDTCVSEAMADSYKYFAKCKIGKKHKNDKVATS